MIGAACRFALHGHFRQFDSGKACCHHKHDDGENGVGHHDACGRCALASAARTEEKQSAKQCPHHATQTVERLRNVESSCRGGWTAEQRDIGVGCSFEQHKPAPYDKQRQQDKLKCAYSHGWQKQKCAYGKQQQAGNHAGACAEAAYEQSGWQCSEEICQINHGLHECRACFAHIEYELVVLVEHIENGSCSSPQKEK